MDASGKRTKNGDSRDRISDLDDNLKSHILERMPITCAVRTSSLSRGWRFSWTTMRKLVFDKKLLDSLGSPSEDELSVIVDRVLLFHQGPIQEFVLFIPPQLRPDALYTNAIFFSLSKKAVQKLICYDRNQRTVIGSYFKMPSYFYGCRGLSRLFLSAHVLKPPPDFPGFSKLVNLNLDHVDITACALATLISQSPLLERLSLARVFDGFSDPFELIAPALKILKIKYYKPGMFILKDTPRLTAVSLQCLGYIDVEHKNSRGSSTLLHFLANIKELTFDLPLLEPSDGEWPNNLDKGFESPNTLNLGRVNISSQKDISFIFRLLRSLPKLKVLNISIQMGKRPFKGSAADEAAAEYLEAEGKKDNKFNNLRKVKIAGVTGLKCEIMLVKVMLSCCMFVEALAIEPRKKARLEEEKQMAWEINGCCRPSTLVKVIYCSGAKA